MNDHCSTNLFTEYLTETWNTISGKFTTLKWLQLLDNDSINMLNSYIDNFDEKTRECDIKDNEVVDITLLVEKLATLETGIWEINEQNNSIATQQLCVLITVELLNRKDLIIIIGPGKITEPDTTSYRLTEMGRMISKSLVEQGI